MPKSKKLKPKLSVRFLEAIQRAGDGGSPLDNETANDMRIDHGTPMLIAPTRDLVALLKRVKAAIAPTDSVSKEIADILGEIDHFVVPVGLEERGS